MNVRMAVVAEPATFMVLPGYQVYVLPLLLYIMVNTFEGCPSVKHGSFWCAVLQACVEAEILKGWHLQHASCVRFKVRRRYILM